MRNLLLLCLLLLSCQKSDNLEQVTFTIEDLYKGRTSEFKITLHQQFQEKTTTLLVYPPYTITVKLGQFETLSMNIEGKTPFTYTVLCKGHNPYGGFSNSGKLMRAIQPCHNKKYCDVCGCTPCVCSLSDTLKKN